MSCDREELLSRYIDGDLSAEESSEMRRHVSSCRECQASFNEIQQREKAFKDAMLPVISSMQLREQVMRRIAAEGIRPENAEIRSEQAHGVRRRLFMPFAIALLFLVVFGLVFYLNEPRPSIDRISIDMIVIMGLGNESAYGRKIMKRGDSCYAPFSVAMPFRGKMAIFLNGHGVNPIVFEGSATLSLNAGSAHWISGEGTIQTAVEPEFALLIGDDRINMTDAGLDISGRAGSYTAQLHRGKAVLIRKGASENLPLVQRPAAMSVKIASPAARLASETASPASLLSPPTPAVPAPAPAPETSSAISSPTHENASDQLVPVEVSRPVLNPFNKQPVDIEDDE